MKVIDSFKKIRMSLKDRKSLISFVPTMGCLHEGHLNLINTAKQNSDCVVVSIFVNRLQFGPKEDFNKYPRFIEKDIEILLNHGFVDFLFLPDEKEVYPSSQNFFVVPDDSIANDLEGRFRPNFFSGVCTVLLKFFSNILPNLVILGKKDYQQFIIVKNMCKQLSLPIEVLGNETIRSSDGLALSSRNRYLNQDQRSEAPRLYESLKKLKHNIISDYCNLNLNRLSSMEIESSINLNKYGWKNDYITVRRQSDLSIPTEEDIINKSPLVVLGASKLGDTRLLDNLEI